MAHKSIYEVKRVMEIGGGEIHHRGGNEMSVNQYLAEGWILLHIYSDSIDSDHGPAQTPVYILGWTNEEAPSEKQVRVDDEKGKKHVEEIQEIGRAIVAEQKAILERQQPPA